MVNAASAFGRFLPFFHSVTCDGRTPSNRANSVCVTPCASHHAKTSATSQQTNNETLTAQQVAGMCANNEERIFRIARLIAGYWRQESWFIASEKIANKVNGGADPAGTLQLYIAANNL